MMEQASLRTPAALQPRTQAEVRSPERPLRERVESAVLKVAVAGLCAATIVAGVASSSRRMNAEIKSSSPATRLGEPLPTTPPASLSRPDYQPIAELKADSGDPEVINNEIDTAYHTSGGSIDIVGPDQDAERAFGGLYDNSKAATPPLSEMIRVQSKTMFGPELKADPNVYPFMVYNTTQYPVDVQFLYYAIQAAEVLRNKVTADSGEVTIAGDTQLDVQPLPDPHALIMVDKMPAFMKAADVMGTDGYTTWYDEGLHSTRSFIVADGPANMPFREVTVATELCQSEFDVSATRTLSLQQTALERFVTYVNPRNLDARYDISIAGKESFCNGFGRIAAAAWQGGYPALYRLPQEAGKTGGVNREPWIDFSAYSSVFPELMQLKDKLANGGQTKIITGEGYRSPTTNYYAGHQEDGPFPSVTR